MTTPSTETTQIPLVVSAKLSTITEHWRDGIKPAPAEVDYLINMAGRYDAILQHARTSDLSTVDWQTALKELNGLEATYLYGGVFDWDIYYFNPTTDNVETLTVRQIRKKVEAAIRHVKMAQESYDLSQKEVKVIGRFADLKRHYGWSLRILADSSAEAITNQIVEWVIEKIEDDCAKKQKVLERFKNPEQIN